jgi:cell shape-determining protein MreC
MSEIVQIIDSLESKIGSLLNKISSLEEKNNILESELKKSAVSYQSQLNAIETLKKDYESLKLTNALLGSEDYKRDTKLKINSLIREIDSCIAQLSD